MSWALHDLWRHKGVWAGVLLALLAAQATVITTSMVRGVKNQYLQVPTTHHAAWLIDPSCDLAFDMALLMTVLIIPLTLNAGIRQRHRALALLSLQGATPWQLLLRTGAQVLVLLVVASLVGAGGSVLLAPSLFSWYLGVYDAGPLAFLWAGFGSSVLQGAALGAAAALVGTLFTLRALTRVSPVEAMHEVVPPPPRLAVARRVVGSLCLLAALALLLMPWLGFSQFSLDQLKAMNDNQLHQAVAAFTLPLYSILPFPIALGLLSPVVLKWVTKLWTALLPLPSSAWQVARAQASLKIQRSSSTVISLTTSLVLYFGLLGYIDTSMAGIRQISVPRLRHMTSANGEQLLADFGPAILIALVGALAGFLITARGRGQDLALVSVLGATPRQRRAIALLDGFIPMLTSLLIFLVYTLLLCTSGAAAFVHLTGALTLVLPWRILLPVALLMLVSGPLAAFISVVFSARRPVVQTLQSTIGE